MRKIMTAAARLAGVLVPGFALVLVLTGSRGGEAHPVPEAVKSATIPKGDVMRGRALVIKHDCGGCHGGGSNPAAEGWLTGVTKPDQEFRIGPCYVTPGAQPCFITRPRNLTPDNASGLGRFSERQLFNSLRFGLRPGETPDVEITSTTPGEGNFPLHPRFLAPPMPWMAWRHMPDQELWDVVAYLKRGLKPVTNKVADSEGPPDFWASEFAKAEHGTYPAAAFPTANENRP